ncbi:hypothetical protein GGX14DRAFT_541371 [Mycena pura]|uniref:Uncharacterized protein n=1 Tax=Mycena pura TaxID=153505 RepID=A0AAD6VNK7_9AGAR|nr:hypothetical protein GGX14DRAFT_541371 [Mycena pura]
MSMGPFPSPTPILMAIVRVQTCHGNVDDDESSVEKWFRVYLAAVPRHSPADTPWQQCHGRGPAFSSDAYGFANNVVIGQRQADAARACVCGHDALRVCAGERDARADVSGDYGYYGATGPGKKTGGRGRRLQHSAMRQVPAFGSMHMQGSGGDTAVCARRVWSRWGWRHCPRQMCFRSGRRLAGGGAERGGELEAWADTEAVSPANRRDGHGAHRNVQCAGLQKGWYIAIRQGQTRRWGNVYIPDRTARHGSVRQRKRLAMEHSPSAGRGGRGAAASDGGAASAKQYLLTVGTTRHGGIGGCACDISCNSAGRRGLMRGARARPHERLHETETEESLGGIVEDRKLRTVVLSEGLAR